MCQREICLFVAFVCIELERSCPIKGYCIWSTVTKMLHHLNGALGCIRLYANVSDGAIKAFSHNGPSVFNSSDQ